MTKWINRMLRVDIITIFPDYFREAFDYGIIRRARAANLVERQGARFAIVDVGQASHG